MFKILNKQLAVVSMHSAVEGSAPSMGAVAWLQVQQRIFTEWRKLEQAKEGTWKNRAYRLAQAVLAREDPQETFLKSLPTETADVEVIYPASCFGGVQEAGLGEKRVRRRLRLLTEEAHQRHRNRMALWVLAMVPQLPLMVTPLPNVTVYYTGYRLYSNYRALQGTKSLERCFSDLSSKQLRALRDDLLRYQARGGELPKQLWPYKLIQQEKEYLDLLSPESLWQRLHPDVPRKQPGEAHGEEPPAIAFTPSVELDRYIRPLERERTPLDDEAVIRVSHTFEVPRLLEHVARARKRAVGSAFPASYASQGSGAPTASSSGSSSSSVGSGGGSGGDRRSISTSASSSSSSSSAAFGRGQFGW
ncbi:hypothetical protein N2152v2_010870 [Parachlorella kessleri]